MIPKINFEFRASAGHAGWICKVLVKTPNNATHETTKTAKTCLAFVQTLRLVIDHIFVSDIWKNSQVVHKKPRKLVCDRIWPAGTQLYFLYSEQHLP